MWCSCSGAGSDSMSAHSLHPTPPRQPRPLLRSVGARVGVRQLPQRSLCATHFTDAEKEESLYTGTQREDGEERTGRRYASAGRCCCSVPLPPARGGGTSAGGAHAPPQRTALAARATAAERPPPCAPPRPPTPPPTPPACATPLLRPSHLGSEVSSAVPVRKKSRKRVQCVQGLRRRAEQASQRQKVAPHGWGNLSWAYGHARQPQRQTELSM
jgi:hypothetical protein